MSDDFMDMLSDPDDLPEGNDPEERGVEDLLGSLMGGAGVGGGDLGSLLGGLIGGGGQQPSSASQQPGGGGDMGDLLGSLLGGGAPQPSQPSQPASGGAGDLLGSLLGGGSSGAAGSGGMGALLGGLLGGGGASSMGFGGGGGVSLPFADTLAEKLGISPQMANMLIMGAIGLLTSSAAKNRNRGTSAGVSVSDLSNPDFIRSSGVSSRLSSEMGISEDEAIRGLQQTFDVMAAGTQPAPKAKSSTAKKTTTKKKSTKKSTKKAADSGPADD